MKIFRSITRHASLARQQNVVKMALQRPSGLLALSPQLKMSFASNFPTNVEPEIEQAEQQSKVKFNADIPDPEIPPDEFKRMQNSIARFSQAMSLGKYAVAQVILDEHKVDIE